MASERLIKLTVSKTGDTKIETSGFPDNTCLKATKSIQELLGKVDDQKLKPEGHVEAPEQYAELYVNKG